MRGRAETRSEREQRKTASTPEDRHDDPPGDTSRRSEEREQMASDVQVLNGIRVVEMTVWVAGPSAGGIMSDWGADVIKVEPPSGDPQRDIYKALGYRDDLPNPSFGLDNRGKRSVVLDLTGADGK